MTTKEIRAYSAFYELGLFLSKKKVMLNTWNTICSCGYTKFDFTVDEGKGRLNPSRDKNEGKHRKRKVEKSCVTSACASTSLTSRINGMTTHARTHSVLTKALDTSTPFLFVFAAGAAFVRFGHKPTRGPGSPCLYS